MLKKKVIFLAIVFMQMIYIMSLPVSALSIYNLKTSAKGMMLSEYIKTQEFNRIKTVSNEICTVAKSTTSTAITCSAITCSAISCSAITCSAITCSAISGSAISVNTTKQAIVLNDVKIDLTKRTSADALLSKIKILGDSDISKLEQIGTSVRGKPIYNLVIGCGDKVVLFTGGVHARETSNPLYLTKFSAELIQSFYNSTSFYGKNVKELLNEYTFKIVPLVNPDGFDEVQFGTINHKSMKSNINFVDINRNFPSYSACVLWPNTKRSSYYSSKPSNSFFPGKNLGSEPETQAVMLWMGKNINSKTHLYIDFHSGGSIIYSGKPEISNNRNNLSESAAGLFSKISGYKKGDGETTGQMTDGTTTDFAYNVSMGMTFDTRFGRMVPQNNGQLVKKLQSDGLYKFAILTVETLKTGLSIAPVESSKPAGKGQNITTSDVENEWTRAHIPEAILSTLDYRVP